MFDERVYWLWLQHAFGAGSIKPISVYKRYNNLEEFYKGGKSLWSRFDFISDKNLASLESYSLIQAEAGLEYAYKSDQNVYTYSCDDYPMKLKNIDVPPVVLYVKGDMPDFDNVLTISVVGSRGADRNAIETTQNLCYELSKKGVIIVSGGAIGIDSAAHIGSLRGTGINGLVLPCGLDYPYLMDNLSMRNQILVRGGCLMTEYPVNTPVYKGSFVVRNRIMSALGNALLVVRAKDRSGTMITVAHATKQNKDIFALPGDINDPFAKGTNKLISDGATPVLSVNDILNQYPNYSKVATQTYISGEKDVRKDSTILSKTAQTVYSHITISPVHISTLCDKTGFKASQVQAAITELELYDYITTYSGQRCSLVKM